MEQEQAQGKPRLARLTSKVAEAAVAIAIFFVGVVMIIEGRRLGMGWASDGPTAGYFPFRIGVIICISSLVVFSRAFFGKKGKQELFVSWDSFKHVLCVLIPAFLYVLVTQIIGIYIASALFIGGFMRAMAGFGWLKIILVSVSISAMLFWMFEIQFMVPLPKGPLESLFGY